MTHITRLDVGESYSGHQFTDSDGNSCSRDECYLEKMDGEAVPQGARDIRVTIDTIDGNPRRVFLSGSYCQYETFVYRYGVLVAHDPGLLEHIKNES